MQTALPHPAGIASHPRGLYALFFTEMWERCSYYGMRALLILFMTTSVERGGLGFSDVMAGAVYGLYTASAYLAALPGGWVADRLIGAQQAILCGGVLIVIGQFTLVIPRQDTFYLGLLLVVLGTGLLKPNISAIVGRLYPDGGARRDAGFTLFYMGINLGSFLGPLLCGWLGERINWRFGFFASGIGMIAGLVQFFLMRGHLEGAGDKPFVAVIDKRDWYMLRGALAGLLMVVVVLLTSAIQVDPERIARAAKWIIMVLASIVFLRLFLTPDLNGIEKRRIGVVAILFLAAAMFFAGSEQAGSSLNLFAERHTDRLVGEWELPAGWFQTVNPLFVILFAPVLAGVWVTLSKRQRDLSLGGKLALGQFFLAAGFVVIALGASRAVAGRVGPSWLFVTFLIHTLGELCVSPVGLSSITKLAPARMVGQVMGLWFMAQALGNLLAGLIAGSSSSSPMQLASQFRWLALSALCISLVLFAISRPMRRWMVGVP